MALTQKQQEFFDFYAPLAQAEQERSGLPASLLLAQLIQESGFVISDLARLYNNFFGIKADSRWKGAKVTMSNKAGTDTGTYRVYPTTLAGIQGRTEFFQQNKRYSNLLQMDNPYDMADELQKVGYATDPNYAASLKSHLSTYNLTQYDNIKYTSGTGQSPAPTPSNPDKKTAGDKVWGFFTGLAKSTSWMVLPKDIRQGMEEQGTWDDVADPEKVGEFVGGMMEEGKKSVVSYAVALGLFVLLLVIIIMTFKGGK